MMSVGMIGGASVSTGGIGTKMLDVGVANGISVIGGRKNVGASVGDGVKVALGVGETTRKGVAVGVAVAAIGGMGVAVDGMGVGGGGGGGATGGTPTVLPNAVTVVGEIKPRVPLGSWM
jgi:hypothetical protein